MWRKWSGATDSRERRTRRPDSRLTNPRHLSRIERETKRDSEQIKRDGQGVSGRRRPRSRSLKPPRCAPEISPGLASSVDPELVDRVEVGQLSGAVPANSQGLLVIDESVTSERLAAEPYCQVLVDVAVRVNDLAQRHPGNALHGDVDPGFFVYLAHHRICWLFARVDRSRWQEPLSSIGMAAKEGASAIVNDDGTCARQHEHRVVSLNLVCATWGRPTTSVKEPPPWCLTESGP